ncbi:MAG TPA: PRC-barrel domain-containing protein [Candidatus Bathyarchaeia archaeon]|nr:PRC-barrel domain-containing protein [Candidatus Bathyarchaeia archaeon]
MKTATARVRSARAMYGWTIGTVDGEVGRVHDVYFEDCHWGIRHLVVETGHWLGGRRVLLPPLAVTRIDPAARRLSTALTQRQVAWSPDVDLAKPVSRQHEQELAHYYGFPSYAVTVGAAVVLVPPIMEGRTRAEGDPHLRSARAISGYYVHARDGDVGHVADFLIDDERWTIRHLVVSVGTWWPTRKVLVPIGWIAEISWGASAVEVSLPMEPIRLAPEYDHVASVGPDYEARLARYYGPAPFDAG